MNKARRKQLQDIVDKLQELLDDLDMVKCDEQDAYDNLPEQLQYGDMGCQLEENANDLDEQYSNLEDLIDNLQDIIDR